MSLISLNFFIFFFIIMTVYFILPGKLQWIWLLFGSLYFYYTTSTVSQFVIFITLILFNWLMSLYMGEDCPHRKAAYICTLIIDILSLVVFKYLGFFTDILVSIISPFSNSTSFETLDKAVILSEAYAPLRISYFGLIIIAYITDVYWGKYTAQKNPGKVLLFASYFPQMTSGPIVRYDNVEKSLFGEKNRFSYIRLVSGLTRVLWGLFKKLVISERLALIVNTIYEHYLVYAGFYIPLAAICFALQLYTDFSGLMDIVLGFSEILGITLPENFDLPFCSLDLSEFWRRWHITLGGFLRDYIMYPLQRSDLFKKMRKAFKKKFGKKYESIFNLPLYLALLVSWFLIGLWHGGGWNYIFGVGLYMWAIIVLSDILKPVFIKLAEFLHINTECYSFTLFRRIRTFLLFCFGLSFFRAVSLKDGFAMWKSAFSLFNPWIFFDESLFNLGLDRREMGILLFSLLLLIVVSVIKQKKDVREWLFEQNYVFRLLTLTLLFMFVLTVGYYGTSFNAADFIYGRF